MSENFKVGEIAIAQYFDNFPEYNGMECEVIDALQFKGIIENDMTVKENVLRYRVRFPDGMVVGPRPHQLRKKIPPRIDEAANDKIYLTEGL